MATARSRGARIRSNFFAYANLLPYVFFVLFPFYFMVVTSFKSNAELYNLKSIPFWIQTGAILDHYALLFQKTDFVTWMKNSLLVAVVATTASVVISILRSEERRVGKGCRCRQERDHKEDKGGG